MPKAVLLGGGVFGLSSAYGLAKPRTPPTIVESRARLGGVLPSVKIAGCPLPSDPDRFHSAKPAALDLIRDLGLSQDVIGSNDHLRVTFVKKNGRLVALPDGLMMMVPTKVMPLVVSPLLSWPTKIRMGMELLRAPKMRGED